MLEQGAEIYPRIPRGVPTCPGGGSELPGAPLAEGQEPAEANQAIHQSFLGQGCSGGGGDLPQKGAGQHGRLAKLRLLDHPGDAFRRVLDCI